MKKFLFSTVFLIMVSFMAMSQCTVTATIQSPACDSTCTGVATFSASGGVMPLSISINGGPASQFSTFFQLQGLCPGNYVVSVIDANGDTCTGLTNFVVPSTPKPNSIVTVMNASCTSCNDGAATATTIGGTAPYAYQWSQGSAGSTIQNLTPGIYYLYTIDANGCMDTDTVIVGIGASGNYTLGGRCYFDNNQNGIQDGGETGLPGQIVTISPGNISVVTGQNGDFLVVVFPGTWDVGYQLNPAWNLTSTPATYNVNLTGTSISNLDFGLYPTSNAGSGYVYSNSGWPRCFWNVPYYPTIVNNGYTMLSGSFTFTHDPTQTFVSSSIVPDLVSGNSYTYNFTNLPPGGQITAVVTLTEPAGGTTTNCITTGNVYDGFGYNGNLSNNLSQVISCSYDPNDKNVNPAGVGAPHFVEMNSWLYYQIRFQNTGTDTAFTVVILDTLDASLDRNTFSVTGSSHPVDVSYTPSGEVTFRFNNILLPDSNINEPASHGFVSYRIKGLASNPDPTPVNNTAYIYFDLNSPVVTNTTLTTLSDNFLGLHNEIGSENWFSLFPNPSAGDVLVKLNAGKSGDYTMSIFDAAGRLVIQKDLNGQDHLSVKSEWLAPGSYMIELKSNETGTSAKSKLIKY